MDGKGTGALLVYCNSKKIEQVVKLFMSERKKYRELKEKYKL